MTHNRYRGSYQFKPTKSFQNQIIRTKSKLMKSNHNEIIPNQNIAVLRFWHKNLLYRSDAIKIKTKTNLIDLVNSNQQNCSKWIKPNENQSIAKLGTTKSHNQIITIFDFSKMNLLYRIHNITIFDNQTMTESFQIMDRTNLKTKTQFIILIQAIHKMKLILKFIPG